MQTLPRAAIATSLARLPAWRRVRGPAISRTFEFTDFPAALRFINAVGRAAEKAEHHPDIDIRWNKVTLTLTTHDAGGLTTRDFDLAARCDQLAV